MSEVSKPHSSFLIPRGLSLLQTDTQTLTLTAIPHIQEMRRDIRAHVPRRSHESDREPATHEHQEYVKPPDLRTLSRGEETFSGESELVRLPRDQTTDKGEWIGIERIRWAKYCNIPLAEKVPDGFPPNTLQVSFGLRTSLLIRGYGLTEMATKLTGDYVAHADAVRHRDEPSGEACLSIRGMLSTSVGRARAGAKQGCLRTCAGEGLG